jgi:hypothetical protein
MTKYVEDIDRGWRRIMREMKLQARHDLVVDIGIIGSEAVEIHAGPDNVFGKAYIGFKEKKKLTNADIGLFHEMGASGVSLGRSGAESGAIPERSFLRATVDEKHASITRLFVRVVRGAIDQKINLKRGLGLVGEKAVVWVKARIRKGIPPPLMPLTIARKGSSKPLIDTGQLLGSITYVVRGPEEGEK